MSSSSQFSSNKGGVGNSSNSYSIPEAPTQHFMLKNNKTKSIVVQNVLTKIPPKNGGTFGPNAFMRVEIPSVSWINCDEFGFIFNLNVFTDAAATTYYKPPKEAFASSDWTNLRFVSLKNGIQAMIQRIKLLWGTSTPAEDIQDYHILMDILREATAPTAWLKNVGFMMEGVHTGRDWWYHQMLMRRLAGQDYASPASASAVTGFTQPEFFCRPHLGVLNMGKYIPAGFTGLMTLEFYFNPANIIFMQSLEASFVTPTEPPGAGTTTFSTVVPSYQAGGTPFTNANASFVDLTYNISSVYFMVSFISPLEEYNSQVKDKLKSGSKIVLYFDTFRQHQRQVPGAWTGDQTFQIGERCASLKTVLAVQVAQGDLTSWFYPRRYQPLGISQYRLRVGDQYFPQQHVNCLNGGIEPYMELQKAFGQFGDIFSTNNILQYEYRPEDKHVYGAIKLFRSRLSSHQIQYNNKFFLCMNFETSMGQLSGMDTLRMNSDIEFRNTYASTFHASSTDDFWSDTVQNNFRAEVSCIPGLGLASAVATGVCPGPPMYLQVPVIRDIAGADSTYYANQYTFAVSATTVTAGNKNEMISRYGQFFAQMLTQPYMMPSATAWSWPVFAWVVVPYAATNFMTTGCNDGLAVTATADAAASTAVSWLPKMRCLLDTRSWGVAPTSWDFYVFTHYDAAMIIETFGTLSFTTDIYNID